MQMNQLIVFYSRMPLNPKKKASSLVKIVKKLGNQTIQMTDPGAQEFSDSDILMDIDSVTLQCFDVQTFL